MDLLDHWPDLVVIMNGGGRQVHKRAPFATPIDGPPTDTAAASWEAVGRDDALPGVALRGVQTPLTT